MDEITRTWLSLLGGAAVVGLVGGVVGALLHRASTAFGQGIKQVQERAEWE